MDHSGFPASSLNAISNSKLSLITLYYKGNIRFYMSCNLFQQYYLEIAQMLLTIVYPEHGRVILVVFRNDLLRLLFRRDHHCYMISHTTVM